ncbi:hypothetical protein ACFQ19_15840 [Oceanobacillus locisalsi]|uniref:Uncharacterized protein n=1 Tax=Oceanobacillus locisalsi TaxID=546107 RepID=A0ABW3NJW7_9BACI
MVASKYVKKQMHTLMPHAYDEKVVHLPNSIPCMEGYPLDTASMKRGETFV